MNGIEIPWKKFNEEEIQTIISILYHSLDYNIKELHKSDRANEDGADLVVSNENEEIAIAVKIKPNNKDRPQLMELSERNEKKKLYIYIETPTKKFLQDTKHYNNVEFWNVNKLNEFFINNNLYFSANLIFQNTETYINIENIKFLFFKLRYESQNKKKEDFKEFNKKSFSLIWRLKDISVTLHKTNVLMKDMFDEPMKFKDENYDLYFLNIFLKYLESLNSIVSSFYEIFNIFYKNNMHLVDNSIIEKSDRSHWLYLAAFTPLNQGKNLNIVLKDGINEKKVLDELLSKNRDLSNDKFDNYCQDISKSNDVWQAIKNQTQELASVGWAIEASIDDIIEEYFKDHNILNMIEYDEMEHPFF